MACSSRIDENRRDNLLDFVGEDFSEFAVFEITRKGEAQLLVALGVGAVRRLQEIVHHAADDLHQGARRGRLGPQPREARISRADAGENLGVNRGFVREMLEQQRLGNARRVSDPPGCRPGKAITGK